MGEPSVHDGRLSIEDGKPWLGLQPSPGRRVTGEVSLYPTKPGATGSRIHFTIDHSQSDQDATVEILADEATMGEPSIDDTRLSMENGVPWLSLQLSPERRVTGEILLHRTEPEDTGSKAYFTIDYLQSGQEATVELPAIGNPPEQLRLQWKNEGPSAAYLRVLAGYYRPEDKLPETHTLVGYVYHLAAANEASPGTSHGNALQQWPTATLTIATNGADGTVFFSSHDHGAIHWEPIAASWKNGVMTIDTAQGLRLGMYAIGTPASQAAEASASGSAGATGTSPYG